MKSVFDGGLYVFLDNILIYVILNCRYFILEYKLDNDGVKVVDIEIYYIEVVEEKVLLLDCFGLWVFFYFIN